MRSLKVLSSIVALSVLAGVSILSACKPSTQQTQGNDGVQKSASSQMAALSEAEARYGVSPKLDKRVTYQPEVIVMEHGAEAIRSQSADGFTWAIDANAQGATEIRPDKILFATGRVVGRVLKVMRKGNELDVTLGPIELTDVIKEAHIDYSGAIDPAKMIVYAGPTNYPGAFIDRDAPAPNAADTAGFPCGAAPYAAMRVAYFERTANDRGVGGCERSSEYGKGEFRTVGTPPAGPAPARIAADVAALLLNGFQIVPDVSKGIGATINYPLTNGMKFAAHAILRLESPRFTFHLDITHGKLNTASVELAGVGGLDVGIEGGTSGKFKNVNQAFAIPIDISFPMPVVVPFAATFHQSILVQTMFTSQQAVIRANGEYKFGGTVTAGIVNGTVTGTAPVFVTTSQNLGNSVSGLSLGVNGLVIGYGGKFIVGLGAIGLVVGPYASVNISAGVTRGSDLQTTTVGYTCRSSTLEMFMDYGVGMALPSWSVAAVNTFLSIFHAKPISADYGHSLGRASIKTIADAIPAGCAGKAAS
jgi:hypothetical protein